MTLCNSLVMIKQFHSSSVRLMLLPICDASLQQAINCGHHGSRECAINISSLDIALIGPTPLQIVFIVLILICKVVVVTQHWVSVAAFYCFVENKAKATMQQLMALKYNHNGDLELESKTQLPWYSREAAVGLFTVNSTY